MARYLEQAMSTNPQIYLSLNSRALESFSSLTMWPFGYHVNAASSTAGFERNDFLGRFPLLASSPPARLCPPFLATRSPVDGPAESK